MLLCTRTKLCFECIKIQASVVSPFRTRIRTVGKVKTSAFMMIRVEDAVSGEEPVAGCCAPFPFL